MGMTRLVFQALSHIFFDKVTAAWFYFSANGQKVRERERDGKKSSILANAQKITDCFWFTVKMKRFSWMEATQSHSEKNESSNSEMYL